jgi:hypothetical protein
MTFAKAGNKCLKQNVFMAIVLEVKLLGCNNSSKNFDTKQERFSI